LGCEVPIGDVAVGIVRAAPFGRHVADANRGALGAALEHSWIWGDGGAIDKMVMVPLR
jgi:hypothetical protein